MSIQIDPSHFTQTHTTFAPKVLSTKEKQDLNENPTTVALEGDIYSANRVSFHAMNINDLKQEEIIVDPDKQTRITTSQDRTDSRVLVAFRNPEDTDAVLTLKLEPEALQKLQKGFSNEDFFQRDDGILRLNGEVEEYVASWYNDISDHRGYNKADINGNGKIDSDEEANLKVGYNKQYAYDYLDEKVVSIHSNVTQSYTRYGDTMEYKNKEAGLGSMGFLRGQSLNFEDSIEKELSHTIMMDKNSDGNISMQEGLEDKKVSDLGLNQYLIDKTKQDHMKWLDKIDHTHDKERINARDISLPEIKTKEELQQQLEEFKAQMIKNVQEQALKSKAALDSLHLS